MNSTDSLIPVLQSNTAESVDDKRDNSQDPESPRQPQPADHGVRGERVDETTKPGTSGGQRVGEGSALVEPLRHHAHGGGEGETHAEAEADTLGQEEVPYLRGEGGADEGDGFEYDSYPECGLGPESADAYCCDGGYQEGYRDGEAAYECKR